MKHANQVLCFCLVLLFVLCPLFSASSVSVSAEPNGGAEIPGIDYSRITRKAGEGSRSYPVELSLGDLAFTGTLSADAGLTYEELNGIIRLTLEEMGLTAERVALVAKIGQRAQKDAALYWGDQVLEGLLSYLKIPMTAFSVSDYYDAVVHESTASAEKTLTISTAKQAAGAAIRKAATKGGTLGKIGRVAKSATGAVKAIPLSGAIENTVMVAKDWTAGSKRFDDYLELLEENLALINDFYAACSRRAEELAETKEEGTAWVIRFDRQANTRSYSFTFWGVPGNRMNCSLSGELTGGKEPDGAYSGTLWLDFGAADLSPVETGLENTPGLAQLRSVLYGTGGYRKTSDVSLSKTVLTREVQGELTVYVTGSAGTVRAETAGNLTSGGDELHFSFGRKLEWRDESMASYGALGITEATFTSSDPSSVTMVSTSQVLQDGEIKVQQDSNETFPQDPGTAFAPLKSTPVLTIRFSD